MAIPTERRDEWQKLVKEPVDQQADNFLRAFVAQFNGSKFEDVLELASSFKKFLNSTSNASLEEHLAHQFLEKRGETATAAALREKLKLIDSDHDHRLSFLEYALYKYDKSIATFFVELHNPERGGGAAFLRAVEEYRAVLAVREARETKMADLEKLAAAGGVKGMAARNTLEQMKSEDQLAMNKAEITSAANKRKAEKNKVDPFEEERARAEADAKRLEEEKKAERDQARARLAAKAAMFNAN